MATTVLIASIAVVSLFATWLLHSEKELGDVRIEAAGEKAAREKAQHVRQQVIPELQHLRQPRQPT